MRESPAIVSTQIARWRGQKGGAVTLSEESLQIYSKGKFRKDLKLAMAIALADITRCSVDDAERSIAISLEGARTGQASEKIFFASSAAAKQVGDALASLMKSSNRTSSVSQETEDARARREQEIQARRQQYVVSVWGEADVLWSITTSLHGVVDSVRVGEWRSAKDHYSQLWIGAEKEWAASGAEPMGTLRQLGEALGAQRGEEVFGLAGLVLKNSIAALQDAKDERGDLGEESLVPLLPARMHLPYLFLFGGLLSEAQLSLSTGEWTGVESAQSRLQRLNPVMTQCFDMRADQLTEGLNQAITSRQIEPVETRLRLVRRSIASRMKTGLLTTP